MKRLIVCLWLAVAWGFCFTQTVQASEGFDSALLRLLIKKGVVTEKEAEELMVEVKKETQKESQPVVVTSSKPVRGIKLGGKLEVRYEDSQGEEPSFKMANFEPNITVEVDEHFSMKGQLECTTDTAKVNEAYGKYADLPGLGGDLIAGKLRRKSFGLYQGGSARLSVDYALLARAFTGERQVGAEYLTDFNKLGLPVMASLAIGVFNGGDILTSEAGDNASNPVLFMADRAGDVDDTQHKEVTGRLSIEPVKGIILGGSVLSGRLSQADISSVNSYMGTSYTNDKKRRYGGDAALKYTLENFNIDTELRSEFIRAKTSDLDADTWYAMGILRSPDKKLDLYGRYSRLDPDAAAATSTKTWDLEQVTLGGIWHFNKMTQLQVEYEFNGENPPAGTSKVDNDMLRIEWETLF